MNHKRVTNILRGSIYHNIDYIVGYDSDSEEDRAYRRSFMESVVIREVFFDTYYSLFWILDNLRGRINAVNTNLYDMLSNE